MTIHRLLSPLAIAAAASLLALPAAAQTTSSGTGLTANQTRFGTSGYFGVNLGQSRYDVNCGAGPFACDDDKTAGHL